MKEWTDRVSGEAKRKYRWFEPEKAVVNYLSEYENILEIGSGVGRYSKYFIDECKNNAQGIFLRADGFNIPIKDNIFDCVFSSGVIEHFDNPIGIIREHVRVCKSEGGCGHYRSC